MAVNRAHSTSVQRMKKRCQRVVSPSESRKVANVSWSVLTLFSTRDTARCT